MNTSGMPGRRPALFKLKPDAAQRLEVEWENRELHGNCNVCGTTTGRWVCMVRLSGTSFRLCLNHANALHAALGGRLEPLKVPR